MATVSRLRQDVDRLVGLAEGDLLALWRTVENTAQAGEALMDVLPALVDTYGEAAAALAAEWYDELRDQYGVAGAFRAIPARIPNSGAQALAGWAQATARDTASMQSLVAGGLARRISNWARDTITASSLQDPRAEGWVRVGRVGACPFCQLLISRGAVYSRSSVTFASHDDCNCGAAPKWHNTADVFDVDDYRRSVRRDRAEESPQREAANARAREWIANNL